MQVYGLRSTYAAAIKKARIIGRPELDALGADEQGSRVTLSEDGLGAIPPDITEHGLSSLLTPDDPALHRQVSHQAGQSYGDEARIANQINGLKRTLADIRRLQNLSVQLGPAVYA